MARILIVEDEEELSRVIADWLTEDKHIIERALDGREALSWMITSHFDLIVLDLNLPSMNGLEVCRRYRESGGTARILILTAKKSLSIKERGLDSGADDFLSKPFKLRELSARIRALLRRPSSLLGRQLVVGNLQLDTAARRVSRAGSDIHLLPKEFALLEALMRSPGQVLSVEVLTQIVWTQDNKVSHHTIRSHVRSLRQKLGDTTADPLIHNVYGAGYKITDS